MLKRLFLLCSSLLLAVISQMKKSIRLTYFCKTTYSVYLLLSAIALGATQEETLVVSLAQEHPLLPIYLPTFRADNSALSQDYLDSLHRVLAFDFNHNGMTKTSRLTSQLDLLAHPGHWNTPAAIAAWQREGIYYVINVSIEGSTLKAALFATTSQSARSIEGIPLSGRLNEDRRQIHLLADSLHKALFQKEGIASARILYCLKEKGKFALVEADYDGANARKVLEKNQLLISPSYVPAKPGMVSSNCLYVSYELGQPKMYVTSLKEGSSPQRISFMKGNQLTPSISRQRDKIAFISDVAGNPDLFVLSLDASFVPEGKPQQVYSFPKATQASPVFSPDGKQIAFASNKDGSTRIYVIPTPKPGDDLKKIKAKLLTTHTKESSAPSWSPDGSKLAFCAKGSDGVRQIWIYDFVQGEERQLTRGPGNKENPSWAPNSLHLLFNSTNSNTDNELFLINLHQPQVEKISSGPGEKRFPSWGS
jgi:TolB protein